MRQLEISTGLRSRPLLSRLQAPDDRPSRDLVGPDLEADQCVRAKGLRDRNVAGIAPLRDQDAPLPRLVVAGIEGVPAPADEGLEPAGEIAHRPRLWRADVAQIPGAISRGNVHATAERNGQMRIVAADALAFLVRLPRRPGGARMLVAEDDVAVNEIADRLHPGPTGRRLLE